MRIENINRDLAIDHDYIGGHAPSDWWQGDEQIKWSKFDCCSLSEDATEGMLGASTGGLVDVMDVAKLSPFFVRFSNDVD